MLVFWGEGIQFALMNLISTYIKIKCLVFLNVIVIFILDWICLFPSSVRSFRFHVFLLHPISCHFISFLIHPQCECSDAVNDVNTHSLLFDGKLWCQQNNNMSIGLKLSLTSCGVTIEKKHNKLHSVKEDNSWNGSPEAGVVGLCFASKNWQGWMAGKWKIIMYWH